MAHIDCLSMKPAANGYIVCFTEKTHKCGSGVYDGCYNYKDIQEVFTDGGKALKRFDELKKMVNLPPAENY